MQASPCFRGPNGYLTGAGCAAGETPVSWALPMPGLPSSFFWPGLAGPHLVAMAFCLRLPFSQPLPAQASLWGICGRPRPKCSRAISLVPQGGGMGWGFPQDPCPPPGTEGRLKRRTWGTPASSHVASEWPHSDPSSDSVGPGVAVMLMRQSHIHPLPEKRKTSRPRSRSRTGPPHTF